MKKRDAVKGRKQEQTPMTMSVAMQQLIARGKGRGKEVTLPGIEALRDGVRCSSPKAKTIRPDDRASRRADRAGRFHAWLRAEPGAGGPVHRDARRSRIASRALFDATTEKLAQSVARKTRRRRTDCDVHRRPRVRRTCRARRARRHGVTANVSAVPTGGAS